MTTFLERLQEERNNLGENIEKLENFINDENGTFVTLSDSNQYLLRRQLVEMKAYYDTLDLRININTFGEDSIRVFGTKGDEIVGGSKAFKYDTRPDVFEIKEAAKKLVNTIQKHAGDSRRTSLAFTNIETGQMYGVKALFTKN